MGANRWNAVQASLFLALMFAGFLASIVVLVQLVSERKSPIVGRLVQTGYYTARISHELIRRLPRSLALNGLQAGIEYRVFHDAGPKVRAGCDGWLFLSEETSPVAGGEQNLEARVRIAQRIIALLAQRHIHVVMLTVPDKARVAADELCGLAVSAQSQARLALWDRASSALSVPRVDIRTGWPGTPGYWRTDTHWDRGGAAFAARRAANVIATIMPASTTEPFHVTIDTKVQPRPGDLLRLSNLINAPSWLQPPPEYDRTETIEWQRAGGLLSTGVAPDIILAGSSYSRNSDFLESLEIDLHREIVQNSEDGGGFAHAILAVLNGPPDALAQAKLILWEFPERSLTQPLSDEERTLLR